MNNIVMATIRLLKTTRPAEITLRDIARESGHGHRLIVEWFGGKGGLYGAVVAKIFEDLAATGDLFYSDVATRPELRAAVRVFNYMQELHPEVVAAARTTFVSEVLRERLQTLRGFSEEQADMAVRRIQAHTMGLAIMAEFHRLPDDVVIEMTKAEIRSSMGFDLPDNPNRT
jgi:AcrR family transcriptional regulator